MESVYEIVDRLTMANRAYQVLYALGDTPATVNAVSLDEAKMWIGVAQSVIDGDRSTEIRKTLAEKMSPAMLRYVATGRMVAA